MWWSSDGKNFKHKNPNSKLRIRHSDSLPYSDEMIDKEKDGIVGGETVDGSDYVVGHDSESAMQTLDLPGGGGFDDVEEAAGEKSDQHDPPAHPGIRPDQADQTDGKG